MSNITVYTKHPVINITDPQTDTPKQFVGVATEIEGYYTLSVDELDAALLESVPGCANRSIPALSSPEGVAPSEDDSEEEETKSVSKTTRKPRTSKSVEVGA